MGTCESAVRGGLLVEGFANQLRAVTLGAVDLIDEATTHGRKRSPLAKGGFVECDVPEQMKGLDSLGQALEHRMEVWEVLNFVVNFE